MIEGPTPGVYPGTPLATYHEWDAASNSRLSRLRRSPAHLLAYMQEPQVETEALRIGRATHAAILEPDDFGTRYVSGPEGDRRTKAVREQWDEVEARYGCGYVLKPAEYDLCLKLRDSVHVHSRALGMISGPGQAELSMLWEDADLGVLCKARWDRYSPEIAGGAIVDIKTTRDASAREFERSLFSNGYHRQGAFYLMGAEARKLPARHFVILAVEKEPPYAVAVYRLTEGAIDAGQEQIRPLLAKYAECMAKNDWPGYPDEVQDIAIPDWAWRVVDDEIREVVA